MMTSVVDDTTPTWVLQMDMYEFLSELQDHSRMLDDSLREFRGRVPDVTQEYTTSFLDKIKQGFKKILEAIKRFFRWIKGKIFGLGPKTTRFVRRVKNEVPKYRTRIKDIVKRNPRPNTVMGLVEYSKEVVYFNTSKKEADTLSWLDWLLSDVATSGVNYHLDLLSKSMQTITEYINTGDRELLTDDIKDALILLGIKPTTLGAHQDIQGLIVDPIYPAKATATLEIDSRLLSVFEMDTRTQGKFETLLVGMTKMCDELSMLENCLELIDASQRELDTMLRNEKHMERESDYTQGKLADRMIGLANKIQAGSLLVSRGVEFLQITEQSLDIYLSVLEKIADTQEREAAANTTTSTDLAPLPV